MQFARFITDGLKRNSRPTDLRPARRVNQADVYPGHRPRSRSAARLCRFESDSSSHKVPTLSPINTTSDSVEDNPQRNGRLRVNIMKQQHPVSFDEHERNHPPCNLLCPDIVVSSVGHRRASKSCGIPAPFELRCELEYTLSNRDPHPTQQVALSGSNDTHL